MIRSKYMTEAELFEADMAEMIDCSGHLIAAARAMGKAAQCAPLGKSQGLMKRAGCEIMFAYAKVVKAIKAHGKAFGHLMPNTDYNIPECANHDKGHGFYDEIMPFSKQMVLDDQKEEEMVRATQEVRE